MYKETPSGDPQEYGLRTSGKTEKNNPVVPSPDPLPYKERAFIPNQAWLRLGWECFWKGHTYFSTLPGNFIFPLSSAFVIVSSLAAHTTRSWETWWFTCNKTEMDMT